MVWFIFVLICSSICIAQPVNGPFLLTTAEAPATLGEAKVVVDAQGTAHVFYEQSANGVHSIVYTGIRASDGSVLIEATTVFTCTTAFRFLEDVILASDGVPKVLVFTADPSDYQLKLVQPSGDSWTATLLFQDQDGWSPEHGSLSHWLEYCRFVAATESYTQVVLYNTGSAGPMPEAFAIPLVCFVNQANETTVVQVDAPGHEIPFGSMRCQTQGPDSLYVWALNYGGDFGKYVVRSDGSSAEIATYGDSNGCVYGELAGMDVSNGDQIHVGVVGMFPPHVRFFRFGGDSCIGLNEILSPWMPPRSASIYENHGFIFPTFDEVHVELLRVDTAGVIAAPVGTIGWRDGNVQIQTASCGASINGEIAVVWRDWDAAESVYNVWLASCDWLTPLDSREEPAPIPQSISLTAYPNPFNATVQIEYELPHAGEVELSIHNTLGQQVATLFNGRATAGTHSLNWSPAAASGIYFVNLQSGAFATSRKILYVR